MMEQHVQWWIGLDAQAGKWFCAPGGNLSNVERVGEG
jgi:hypothetical protein